MKSVGIFICNYNKREFVINCVKSLLDQTFKDFDLFVVDNASIDDSVEKLREAYGDKITIIENSENLGGSGGFNTGIKRGYDDGYEYIMLVDNDTVFDKNAVFELYKFLTENKDVGMVGAKIYQMQKPEYIQAMGGIIDWKNYDVQSVYKDLKDSDELENIVDVDYLAACALMTRREVVEKIGMLDESCFIYYDDTEWGYRCKLNGYRCCAISSAKVWHNCSFAASKTNKGLIYYNIRNGLNFFSKYISLEEIDEFTNKTLSIIYKRIIGYYCKNHPEVMSPYIYAICDFINGVRGKAPEFKTNAKALEIDPFVALIQDSNDILVTVTEKFSKLATDKINKFCKFLNECKKVNPRVNIYIKQSDWKIEDVDLIKEKSDVLFSNTNTSYDRIFSFCNHVAEEKELLLPQICVDEWLNCIYNEEVYEIYKNIDINAKIFINFYKNMFINKFNN